MSRGLKPRFVAAFSGRDKSRPYLRSKSENSEAKARAQKQKREPHEPDSTPVSLTLHLIEGTLPQLRLFVCLGFGRISATLDRMGGGCT